MRKPNKYLEYEKKKSILKEQMLSPEEYEREIIKLARRLKI